MKSCTSLLDLTNLQTTKPYIHACMHETLRMHAYRGGFPCMHALGAQAMEVHGLLRLLRNSIFGTEKL